MTDRPTIDDRVRDVLRVVLERDIGQDEYVSRTTETAWDSLKHIEVIFSLEGAFGIRFQEDEFAELSDVPAIARAVDRHLAA